MKNTEKTYKKWLKSLDYEPDDKSGFYAGAAFAEEEIKEQLEKESIEWRQWILKIESFLEGADRCEIGEATKLLNELKRLK